MSMVIRLVKQHPIGLTIADGCISLLVRTLYVQRHIYMYHQVTNQWNTMILLHSQGSSLFYHTFLFCSLIHILARILHSLHHFLTGERSEVVLMGKVDIGILQNRVIYL